MKIIHKGSLHRAPMATCHELKDNTKEQERVSFIQVKQRRKNSMSNNLVKKGKFPVSTQVDEESLGTKSQEGD